MVFNSIEFVVFFAFFFLVYYFPLKEKTNFQNIFLLISSYFFYAWASWKILPILVLTTIFFYWLGIAIYSATNDKIKIRYLVSGLVVGIGMLLYFKYTNFLITSFTDLFEMLGFQTNMHTLKIILPLGVSFYTFRLLSYVIDINRGKYEPTRDFVAFATYVAFFPTILSGPIDRPNTLIPQLQKKRIFDNDLAVDGCQQILWGLFKKMVVADNCATYVDQVYSSFQSQSASTLLLGAFLYTFQLYADFSGYSDIAIGLGKLLGFNLTKNFNYPLFAQNIADYWRRWHISLTSWLTDYVFMPLNIKWRNIGNWGMIFGIIVNFLICGLWHGGKWTFVLWGLYNGLLYIPLILTGTIFKKNKLEINSLGFPKLKHFGNMLLTFLLVSFGQIIFRAKSIEQAVNYIRRIFDMSLFRAPLLLGINGLFFCIFILLFIEWVQRTKSNGLEIHSIRMGAVRWSIYLSILVLIFFFGGHSETFIYFQF